jgi:hypothetical protein
MIGTLVGAVAIVVLTACFPQDRVLFLGALALWGGASALAATLLRNFAAYAAALAGYTAAIVAATYSAPPAGSMQTPPSCSLSAAEARSSSASFAPASFSPPPISATPRGAWLRCSRPLRPGLLTDLSTR